MKIIQNYILILIFSFFAIQSFSQNKTYEYDELNRLSKAHYFDGATEKYYITYTYDEVGNRMSKVVNVLSVFTGLIAHYPFTGNSNDISGNTNNGTPINGATLNTGVKGEVNGAYCLDGIDDYINTPIQQNNVSSYSISAWVKTSMVQTAGGNSFVVAQTRGLVNAGGRSLTLRYDKSSGSWFFGLDTDFIIVGQAITMNNNNQWMHITGTWSGVSGSIISQNQFKIYINGTLQTSNNYGSNTTITAPISGLGTTKIGYHEGWNSYFPGCIDNVRIYQNQTLTSTEVLNIYNSEKPCPAPTAILSGTQTITAGQTANLSVTLTGVAPWSIVMNGTTYTANASPFSIPVSPSTTTTYTLTSVSNSCVAGTVSGSAVVTVNPACVLPTATIITPNITINQGQSAVISIRLTGTPPLTYKMSDNFTHTGISISPYTANIVKYLSTTKTYSLISVSNNCGIGTVSGSTVVTVIVPCTIMQTTKSGDWNNPTVWSCNRVPTATDNVTIIEGHIINVPSGVFSVKNITLSGTISYSVGGELRLNP